MEEKTRSELRKALLFGVGASALVLVALAYRPALDAGFIWDDHVLAKRDAAFRHVSILELFTSGFWPASPLTDAPAQYYRPVVLLSLRADLALGDEAGGFHFTNLLLHLVACTLVAIVAVRAGARTGAAILAALLWGLTPRLSESVAWIVGRTDVLATVFGLAAIALSPALDRSPDARRRRGREIATACLLFLALASKEVALAFAVAIVAAQRKRDPWRDRLESAGIQVGAPTALWLVLRAIAFDRPEQAHRDLGALRRIGTVFEATERYVEMTFDALRPRTSIGMLGDLDRSRAVTGVVLLLVLLALLAHAVRRGGVGASIGACITATAIAPVLHAIPFALSGAVTADRLLYAPLAGLAIAIASGAAATTSFRKKGLAAAALVIALFFFAATRARAADYTEEGRFWLLAAESAHPANPMPLRALAAYIQSDEPELACRLYERARERASAVAIVGAPAHRRTLGGLAACWIKLGRYEEARTLLEEVATRYPTNGRVWMELGYAREHTLNFDGAASAFAKAAALDGALVPMMAQATSELARVRGAAERFSDVASRAADPAGYADFLAEVGHLPEAELAYFALVRDAAQKPAVRATAMEFVVEYGRLDRAESLLADQPSLDRHSFITRRRRHAAVQRLRPRIEALLSP